MVGQLEREIPSELNMGIKALEKKIRLLYFYSIKEGYAG